ncbi:MAG: polysaccharide biosynthesis/export family protein, partial [Saprospiraceae bacterium]
MFLISNALLRKRHSSTYLLFYLLVFGLASLTSCVKYRDLVNFQEGPRLDSLPMTVKNLPAYRLQSDDILNITVYSSDKAVAEPFNLGLLESTDPTKNINSAVGSSYLIDEDGRIVMPVIGSVTLAGLTLPAARDTLINRVGVYLKKPMVHIRLQNFKVTVMGEVTAPSTLTFSDDKVTILEALGNAGDLTQYARRDNILIIREQNGQREFGRVNLKSGDLFQSKYYYLT